MTKHNLGGYNIKTGKFEIFSDKTVEKSESRQHN